MKQTDAGKKWNENEFLKSCASLFLADILVNTPEEAEPSSCFTSKDSPFMQWEKEVGHEYFPDKL